MFTKFLLTFVNLIFFMLGLLMLSFGIVMFREPDMAIKAMTFGGIDLRILANVKFVFNISGIILTVLGSIIGLVAAFGFFGACYESKSLLMLYVMTLSFVLNVEVALAIFAAVHPSSFADIITRELHKTMIENYTQDVQIHPNSTVKLGSDYFYGYLWAALQFGVKCCGVNGSSDYLKQERYNATLRTINYPTSTSLSRVITYPISCCSLKDDVTIPDAITHFQDLAGCLSPEVNGVGGAQSGTYNTKGCYDSVYGKVMQMSKVSFGIAVGIVGFEILFVVLATILLGSI